MNILTCDSISLSYGTKEILKDISFSINEGEKLGIIGVNGAGKTTLLNIILGECEPTSGRIFLAGNATVAMLKQHIDYDFHGKSVYEYALSSFSDLIFAEQELELLSSSFDKNANAAEVYNKKQYDFILKGGAEYKTKTKSLLARLSFKADMYDFPAQNLSGGQKTRLALAALLLSSTSVIILDEPTNHLDIDTVEWLEHFISSSQKTFIIVSHDRYFLDKVTNETLEIENLTATKYSGSYSEFKEKKKKLLETQEKHYNLQQKEIKRLEAFIENQRKWNRERNIIAAESRQKAIDRMVKIEKPKTPPKSVSIKIGSTSGSNDVLSVRDLSKSYNEPLFENLSFELKKGERMFIIGSNGCGKSTLLKIINGVINDYSGIFELGYSQTVGYYDQEIQLFNNDSTVIDELLSADEDLLPAKARAVLAQYGFVGDDVFKPITILSGGEKARLSIAKLVLKNVSLLILDEPTNHLDIPSKEVLESALLAYNGTLLTVSHDRYFISALATRILEIDKNGYDNGYFDFNGNFELFLQKRQKRVVFDDDTKDKTSKNEYLNTKRERSQKKSAQKRYDFLTLEIEKLENREKQIESELTLYSDDYEKVILLTSEDEQLKIDLEKNYEEYFSLEI